ncbi:hypothetical protein AK812_SmicGene30612 [Symbiodinium microadriaticum]|uniref:Uncharacterized protein n=1 Tax=Symbiodinium microadriaticum TaxID=2951 RepID=A0A1Q9CYT9_SYMMI|nr:hypothetical protein AK812_SmicGene30612 [Symbiodinium microadriaticum]
MDNEVEAAAVVSVDLRASRPLGAVVVGVSRSHVLLHTLEPPRRARKQGCVVRDLVRVRAQSRLPLRVATAQSVKKSIGDGSIPLHRSRKSCTAGVWAIFLKPYASGPLHEIFGEHFEKRGHIVYVGRSEGPCDNTVLAQLGLSTDFDKEFMKFNDGKMDTQLQTKRAAPERTPDKEAAARSKQSARDATPELCQQTYRNPVPAE